MTDGTLALFAAALRDRYAIEREIGQGGMATVYLARDLRHDRQVAIKLVHPELAAILGAQRFLAEIKVTASLQHPHILPLLDSGEADRQLFYVMPFVEGESLRRRLQRERQLPVDDAVRLAREVASALDYAHRHGIVHRDVKPENVLLQDGQALVADFGIALAVNNAGGGRLTQTGLSLGTPSYMSPEQAMGERDITPKSDVYSLGAMLYEMLAGEPPFTGPSAQAIVARVITEQPRALETRRETVPHHVAEAVRTALAKLPADRFASAAGFAEALARPSYATTVPVQPGPAAAARPARVRRRTALLVAGLSAAVLLALLAAWTMRRPPPTTHWQRIVLGIDGRPLSLASVGPIAIAADGAIAFSDTLGGTRHLWLKERDRLDATAIGGTAGGQAPFFSPDGRWIAFVADRRLKKVLRQGGSAAVLADSANEFVPGGAWLDDGNIVFNTTGWSLVSVGSDGGAVRTLATLPQIGRGIGMLSGLPDSRGVLFTACTANCLTAMEIWAWDARTGKPHRLVEEAAQGQYLSPGRLLYLSRQGTLLMAPFDLGSLKLTGTAVSLLDDVRSDLQGLNHFRASPGGALLLETGGSGTNLQEASGVWVSRDGAVAPVDSGWTPFMSTAGGVALSPDGTRLAVTMIQASKERNTDVWIKQLDRGPVSRLTFSQAVLGRPAWSPDGAEVRFLKGDTVFSVWSVRADGSGEARRLRKHALGIYELESTPDGAALILRVNSVPEGDIALARLSDTTITPLLATDFNEKSPAVSPDGRWLAYVSDESGRDEVYVRPFPRVSEGRWQVSKDGGTEPRWAHSGRELFYRMPGTDGAGSMMAVEVVTTPVFAATALRPLFADSFLTDDTHHLYAVARDDRRFLMWRPVAGEQEAPGTLVLAEHWLKGVVAGARR